MTKTLTVKIKCGEKTCASKPGKFCSYVGTAGLKAIPVCRLFPTADNSYTVLKTTGGDPLGWLLRCPECLKAEVKETR